MYRNHFLDYLKGIAIILVVWAHAIQYLDKGYDFSQNGVYMCIYSFHMPLFMTISGYLFSFSVSRKDSLRVVKVKSRQLLLPILCWAVIMPFLFFYKELMSKDFIHGLFYFFRSYIRVLPYYLWFLWALFVISILVSFVASKFKDKVAVHILMFILLLGFTDKYGLIYMKYMYPYFLFGYFYNLYRDKFVVWKKPATYISLIAFPILLFFWSKQDLIYHSGMSIYNPDVLKELMIAVERYAIGFAGTIVVVTIFKNLLYFPPSKFITRAGTLSLGIYIIQTVIFAIADIFVPSYTVNYYVYTFIFTLTVSILIIIITMYLTRKISEIPVIGKALFGGRY